ncbi:NAD(P)H-binding protein [Planomonospora sp. ID67723]|nr:NAD(P)H-binding protein [Planomonospora sp. ID67723]
MYLLTGSTGTIGREVMKLLVDAGEEVTAVTRAPHAAKLPADVRVAGADPETLASALEGVTALLLAPRAVGDTAAELLRLAAERGVQRVVLLSAITVEYGGGYERFAAAFTSIEAAVAASGLAWTFLRCADFAANTLAWAPQIRATGTVRGAYGNAATASVHERDIAEVAVRALRDPAHAGRRYALTGPQPLTQHDKVRLIGEAIGRRLAFQEITHQQARQAMLAQGLPEDVPDRMLGYLSTCADQPGPATDTVERVLGRPALPYAEWAIDHADAFCGS